MSNPEESNERKEDARFSRPVRLPIQKKLAVKLPQKRKGPLFPVQNGKTCQCPYCEQTFTWPPENLECPACSRKLCPPPGFAPADMKKRRILKEKLHKEHDEQMKRLGPRAGGKNMNRIGTVFGLILLLFVGSIGVFVSRGNSGVQKGSQQSNKFKLTEDSLLALAMACEHFKTDVGEYPQYSQDQGDGLLALIENTGYSDWGGPYVKKLINDGWGRPFVYQYISGQDKPTIYSAGPDRKFGTADDIYCKAESFRVHPDFIPHREPAKTSHSVLLGGQAK